ncbi:MAG: response regulator [Spirochaetota bacterium]
MNHYKILLLEDEKDAAELVIRILSKYNIDITHYDDARLALPKLKSERFDLIISDIMMPVIDGFTFLEKAGDWGNDTPVILLTAYSQKENIMKAVDLNVSSYLVKPFEANNLLSKICQAIQIQETDLLKRTDLPFVFETRVQFQDTLSLMLYGIPAFDHVDRIKEKLDEIKSPDAIKTVKLHVSNDLCYHPQYKSILQKLLLDVIDRCKVTLQNIHFLGSFFQNNLDSKNELSVAVRNSQ